MKVRIYNNDGANDIWICEFKEGMFVYRLPLGKREDEMIPASEPLGFKVIGNIYENPKLNPELVSSTK